MGLSWCKFDVFTTSLSGKWIEMQIMLVKAVGTSGSSLKLRFTWISTPFVRGTSLCTKCTERTIPSICDVIENAIYFTFLHFFFFQVHDGRVENGTVQT